VSLLLRMCEAMLYLVALGLYQPVPGREPSPIGGSRGCSKRITVDALIDAHWRSRGRWSMDRGLSSQKERMDVPNWGLQMDVGGFPGVFRRRLHSPEASHDSHAPSIGGTGTTKGANGDSRADHRESTTDFIRYSHSVCNAICAAAVEFWSVPLMSRIRRRAS